MQKYYVLWSHGSLAETKEFCDQSRMLECVRLHHERFGHLPTVYFGEKLEFEPAEVVRSWKVK